MTCVVCLKLIFCCNYFEVLHLYKLPASAYFKVCGGAFDLAVEVTQIHLGSTFDPGTILYMYNFLRGLRDIGY